MDPERGVGSDRLRRDIEASRASISGTVSELRQKVDEAVHWQTYVKRHPASILATVALVGFVAGRRLGVGLMARRQRSSAPPEGLGAAFTAPSASLKRLDSRVEALANRVIDEVADAAERALVPALAIGLRTFFEGRRAQDSRGQTATYNAVAATAGEGRLS